MYDKRGDSARKSAFLSFYWRLFSSFSHAIARNENVSIKPNRNRRKFDQTVKVISRAQCDNDVFIYETSFLYAFCVWKLKLIGGTLGDPRAWLFCNKSCDWSVLWQHSRLSFLLAIKNRFNEQNKNVINADIPKNKAWGAKSCQTEERRAAGCQWFRNTTENRRVVNRSMWVKPATCLAEHEWMETYL